MHHPRFHTGQRVRLSQHSPIESEGVAPRPGHAGVIEAAPDGDDRRRCWAVRFDGVSLAWRIPEHLLEVLDETASMRERRAAGRAAA